MRHTVRFLGLCMVLSMAVTLTGCTSVLNSVGDGWESDLVPGTTPAPSVGTAKFYIADVKSASNTHVAPGYLERLRSDAVSARPNLFSDDFSAVPLVVGLVVGPSDSFSDSITVPTMGGGESLGSVAYTLRFGRWSTPPDDAGTPAYIERCWRRESALDIEAVVKALGQCDAAQLAKLQALYDSRKSRIQSLSLDGKPAWGFVGFGYSKPGASSGPKDVADLHFSTQAPTFKSAEAVVVARRGEDGHWRPCNGYLRKSQTLTAATVLLENGLPGRVVLRPVEEPEIDDFIDLPVVDDEKDRAESIRWSNGVLLQVKNRTLPRLVRERSGTELLDLASRVEKVVLMLDEMATKCKDSAQQVVEEGKGDPAPAREMAILYGQRRDILIAIVATIKQEAARKKP